jgi:hypothetical protein
MSKEKENCICEFLKSHWFLYGIIIILLGVIVFNQFYQITGANNVTYILSFVGILATFIVISNYAQVQEIKRNCDSKVEEIKRDCDKLISTEVEKHYVDSFIEIYFSFYSAFEDLNRPIEAFYYLYRCICKTGVEDANDHYIYRMEKNKELIYQYITDNKITEIKRKYKRYTAVINPQTNNEKRLDDIIHAYNEIVKDLSVID